MGRILVSHLVESASAADIAQLNIAAAGHQLAQGAFLHQTFALAVRLNHGHEGQGVGPEVASQAQLWVRIAQPGARNQLNVAAAAAICLHASALQACKQVG